MIRKEVIRLAIGLILACCFIFGCSAKSIREKDPGTSSEKSSGQAPPSFSYSTVAPLFSKQSENSFEFLYRHMPNVEFVLCLEGEKKRRIYVEVALLAIIESATRTSVKYEPCTGARYLGTAHNHPPVDDPEKNLCYQSEPDVKDFTGDRRAVIDIVLCGNGKLIWVMRNKRWGIVYFPKAMIEQNKSSQ